MKTNIFEASKILQSALKDFSLIKMVIHDGPRYELPKTTTELLELFTKISTVFNQNMSFNGKSPYAEEYALYLIADKKQEEALELFDLIAGDKKDLLFLYDPPNCGAYISEEVSRVNGMLGYEGIFQYAKLLLEKNPERAKKLLLEIAEKIPTICYPLHLGDIRVETITLLKDLGVHKINNMPIKEALQKAKSHQC